MRLVNDRLEFSSTLFWMAACAVIALQYTSKPGALAASAGAMLGCIAARLARRRGSRLELAITMCPFVGALLLLPCSGLQPSQFAGTIPGPIPVYEFVGILVFGGTAFCVSLALDLLRAEFPQAAAVRVILAILSFASFLAEHHDGSQPRPYSVVDFILHAEHDPVDFFLLLGVVIASGAVIACVADPRFTAMAAKYPLLLTLLPKGRLHPSANPLQAPSELR